MSSNRRLSYRRRALVICALLCLAGCTRRYRAAEYVIAEERISGLTINGPVRIEGADTTAIPQVVYSRMGTKWVASYPEVTSTLVNQLIKEIGKRGGRVDPDAPKVIRLEVLELRARDAFVTIDGSMRVRMQLGEREPKELEIQNKSPANLMRALNGSIARTVIAILQDPDVQLYLAGNTPSVRPAGVELGPP